MAAYMMETQLLICFLLILTPTALLLKDLLLEAHRGSELAVRRSLPGLTLVGKAQKHREIQSKVFQKDECILIYSLEQIALKKFILTLFCPWRTKEGI